MKATIRYRVASLPHPWDDKLRGRGVEAWCLVKIVEPEIGPRTEEPVAVFNLDSEAITFQGHVLADGLDGKLIEVDREFREAYRGR